MAAGEMIFYPAGMPFAIPLVAMINPYAGEVMYFAEVMDRQAETMHAHHQPISASHPVIRPRPHSPVGPVLVVVACIGLLIGLTVLSALHAQADREKARSTPRQMPMIHLDR